MSRESAIRFTGPFLSLSAEDRTSLFNRGVGQQSSVGQAVAAIILQVRLRGDTALKEMALEFDRVELADIEVPRSRLKDAFDSQPVELRKAMERSGRNIEAWHRSQITVGSSIIIEPGVTLRRRPDPVSRVGVYAPGGRASYPSSVLMGAIPARVAGVGEIILCSPPDETGLPDKSILAAAYQSGVDRVFALGGAGAIAAMCLGTTTVPRVDKVVGPGNAYVAEAKLQLANSAAFDSPAGPSEVLIIADNTSNPSTIVREMLAQAEHDPLASVVVLAIGEPIATRIHDLLYGEISKASRKEIIRQSLEGRGALLSIPAYEDAIAISNEFAPEHLLIATSNAPAIAEHIRNAGTIFLGESSSVAFGDYMTGANHVLPTGGLARSYSGLSTLDFIRWTTLQSVTPDAAASLASDVNVFATAEGLHAHAAAAFAWAEYRP